MSIIIDGHNLIGVLPDIELGEPGDELRLLERLRGYRLRNASSPLIVFFDSGDLPVAGQDPSTPGLQVRFSDRGASADDAIIAFLQSRAQPGQYAVVTNDRDLQYRARAAGASVIPAAVFAARLALPRHRTPPPVAQGPDPHDPAFADIYTGFVEAERNAARFGTVEGVDAADIAAWTEQLYGEDSDTAQRAARWLGQFGGEQSLAPLRDALTHSDARIRAAALLALADLGMTAAVPDLCRHLAGDAASMAREAAAQGLARIGDRSAEDSLERAVKSDPKGKVRRAAAEALRQIRARRVP